MTEDLAATVRPLARKYALENAVKHGQANPGAVVGKIMGERADLRAHGKAIPAIVAEVVAEVNAMPADARAAAFAEVAGEVGAARRKEEARGPLKPLANAEKGKVVLRLAPNPSGPPHFGHGRGMVINWVYKEMYDGRFILRFDDTDTTVKPPWPPAYDMFPETLEWLCGKADKVIRASDHMAAYYRYAEEAIAKDGAYVCECVGDDFRKLKEQALPCPHRGQSIEENLAKWRKLVDGGYRRGEAVLRIKTDIAHKDPALRDWVAFRIAEEPHPLVGDKYKAWPLLDFQSAIDDHLEGVTHIIRGKDLRDSTAKQEFLYAHLGWKYPETSYWGRVSVHEFGKFSKSILQEAIRKGEYEGWDDPRLPTFPALRRRGIQPEAIRNFWVSLGISEKDIAASVQTLEAENKKLVEKTANRYFFVADPVEILVQGVDELASRSAKHPDHPERGERVHHVRACPHGHPVLLAREDYDALKPGARVRLKDLANLTLTGCEAGHHADHAHDACAKYEGNSLDWTKDRSIPIVQWVPHDGAEATLLVVDPGDPEDENAKPTIRRVVGSCERQLLDEPVGAVVQLERVGFARVDAKTEDSITLVFAHK